MVRTETEVPILALCENGRVGNLSGDTHSLPDIYRGSGEIAPILWHLLERTSTFESRRLAFQVDMWLTIGLHFVMPAPATSALKAHTLSKGGANTRLRRLKEGRVLIRPTDLQARVVETVQRLQNFHQSLEAAGSTYTPKRLQTLSEKLAAIHDQSKHLPKFQEAIHANGRPAELESGRVPARRPPLTAATPGRAVPRGLGQLQALVEATGDLRAAGGNLSAEAVADAFGVSINQLAGWLGRTRQALSKTPDADSLQDGLTAFEQVARLRTVLAPEAFRKWLRMPNGQLDGAKPLDLLATGQRRPIVAGLVEDMLTGMPT